MRTVGGVVMAVLVAGGCTGGSGEPQEPIDESKLPVITSAAQIGAAENQVVRLRGRIFHEKLGDGVEVDGVAILCPDVRIADTAIEVTLQGRLEQWEEPVASMDDSGAISQGSTEATSRWILRDCKQV
jgi:hypothetical protein